MSNIGGVRTIKARLDKLEQTASHTEARQILICNGGPLSDEDLAAFLKAEGIEVGPDDMIVRMITVYETKPGEPKRVIGPPSLLGVHSLKRSA